MKKSIKAIIGLLAVLIIILLLPFAMGFLVEKKSHKIMGQITSALSNSPNVEIKLLSYKRGWFHSEAVLALHVSDLKINRQTKRVDFTFHEIIKHGPFILDQNPKGKLDFFIGQALIKTQMEKSSLTLTPLPLPLGTTLVGFKGGQDSWVYIKSLEVDFSNVSVLIKNVKDSIGVSVGQTRRTNHFELGQAMLTGKNLDARVNNIKVDSDIQKNSQGLSLGKQFVGLESASLTVDGKTYSLKGINSASSMFENNGRLTLTFDSHLESLDINGQHYGPHRLDLDVKGVSAAAMAKLNEASLRVAKKNSLIASEQMRPLFLDLLDQGLSVQLKALEISTPWGEVSASSEVNIPDQSSEKNKTPLFLKTTGKMDIQMPKQLVSMLLMQVYQRMMGGEGVTEEAASKLAEKHLERMVFEGWLVSKEGQYDAVLLLQDGKFLINNKPLKMNDILPKRVEVVEQIQLQETLSQPSMIKQEPAGLDKPESLMRPLIPATVYPQTDISDVNEKK